MHMHIYNPEQGNKNKNHAADREIGFLTKRWRRQITNKVIPKRLWDFGLFYDAKLLSRISRGKIKQTGYEEITDQTL